MAIRSLAAAGTVLLLAACAGMPPAADRGDTTFVVVRHAEKAGGAGADPALDPAGHERALALARLLADSPLVAIHTTGFRRTRQTVQPVADGHGIAPSIYEAALPADEFAARLRSGHARGTVLVAGHSNTVPGIVAALCACPAADMPETEYDRLSTVRIDAEGRAHLQVTRFGAPPATPPGGGDKP